ncbi:L domain-like protein [Athelia psychrophila]|uniref:L domain-like protein n=1 Tax=Athelia psychrophila TaxID=1759441 RepID=A0A166WXF0_9AGAM|nr:L domain-like protein [Fibularhizoctonia sp. CBS 109695]
MSTDTLESTVSSSSRKPRSTRDLFPRLLKKKSNVRLTADSDRQRSISVTSPPPVPFLDISANYTSTSLASTSFTSSRSAISQPSTSPPLRTSPPSRFGKGKSKNRTNLSPPQPPAKDPREPEFTLDTNLEEMDGIIDIGARPDPQGSSPTRDSFESSRNSIHSEWESFHPITPVPAQMAFNIPFNAPGPSIVTQRPWTGRSSIADTVSPMSPTPPAPLDAPPPTFDTLDSWEAPESWAVERVGEDLGEPDYSSSDESASARPPSIGPNGLINGNKKSRHRKSTRPLPSKTAKQVLVNKPFKVRIYRADNTYHVASIGLHVTVADLAPVLNSKLLFETKMEMHRLYLKERGRERILAQTEKPADIIRRRLEQVGYDIKDNLPMLGAEDISFLLKFVYKTQLLGPAEEDLGLDTFEHINLKGRSLRAIPVVLHAQAETITTLNLSSNPMLEIPLDFIQSCVTLRELRLSNMAIKRVPASLRQSISLYRLDLSSNRIQDLNEAGLDQIPKLATLNVQNNRMEKLPWYFPRLAVLKHLNISNNKFHNLPSVICEMDSLVDLDISFNNISDLPEQIGQLKLLDRLTMVGNCVSKFPDECSGLINLRDLDCRRNNISDISVVCMLPKIKILRADYNIINTLDLAMGPSLSTLEASHNDITRITLIVIPALLATGNPYALTSLDISHAKLSSLDEFALGQLSSLETLKLDHNSFRVIPESLGELSQLKHLSCSDNALDALPASMGRLQRLETLDAHNNSILAIPVSIWNCASLTVINVTSNQIGKILSPFAAPAPAKPTEVDSCSMSTSLTADRKPSAVGSVVSQSGRSIAIPPLTYSLERLYIGENLLTEDSILPLTMLKELRVLNLSFNEIQEIPPSFFQNLTKLEELYLSGNKLTSLPAEDLPGLTQLSVLLLNGNKLQTLPHELGKISTLSVLDVGSNILRYNINNWQFDWNWNFNSKLVYLNLSGNKRLEIKADATNKLTHTSKEASSERKVLADFSSLTQLKVLGLMDVTTTFAPNIPEDNEDRRVRTSLSEVNKMAYGIADHLGGSTHLNMLDLVQPHFRDSREEAVFAMFGLAQPSTGSDQLSKFLHDKFLSTFTNHLNSLNKSKKETVQDALRRSFLRLNKDLHDELLSTAGMHRKMSQASNTSVGSSSLESSMRSGASGIVLYLSGKTLYIANAGNALAVISQQGTARLISKKHDPFDRSETARIRAAEGWVTPKGLVNEASDTSRSFGFYHLLPVVNARPDINEHHLTEADEFVIIGNRGLWDYVSYQTAVDIARSERDDPMIAAQKLRDFAISYGAKGSTMIMVIAVSDLFNSSRDHQHTSESAGDYELPSAKMSRRKEIVLDPGVRHLSPSIPAPTGHLALVFTDIRNSTHLWEVNPGMQTAMRLHNTLLRRQLRFFGGFEVKTEGDAFMCAFPNGLSALQWALEVQLQLLQEPWPLEILECEDGKPIYDANGLLVAKGLSVRMGIHCGQPVCEIDPVTQRMDYFGPMVNRSARIQGSALGGQIMVSADIVREINSRFSEPDEYTEYSDVPQHIIDALVRMKMKVIPKGEFKLKGLEIPEALSLVYPEALLGREDLEISPPGPSASAASKIKFSIEQMRQLGLLCLRLEALSSSRIFRPLPVRKGSTAKDKDIPEDVPEDASDAHANIMYGDPTILLPSMHDQLTDAELMVILDSLAIRVDNALASLAHKHAAPPHPEGLVTALQGLDEQTLREVLSALL